MDELELLKKDWKNQEHGLPKLSYAEIYEIILKKSSSIVRWIFIISIIEFLLWTSLDVIFRLYGLTEEEDMGSFSLITSIISYCILIYFITRFYLNYKKIRATDSTKVLMENIIKTRRTVKQYIWVNIGFFILVMFATIGYMFFFTDQVQNESVGMQMLEEKGLLWLVMVIIILVISVFVGFLILFYRIVYGILTRRLKKNYKELEKLEV